MQHKNVAKGATAYFFFTSKDPTDNGSLNDIEDSGRAYAIEEGSAASGGVITAGITLTKRTGTGAPSQGLYQIDVDTSDAAYDDGGLYTIFAEGDVVGGGSAGITAEPIGVLAVAGSITLTDVQSACESAIQAVGIIQHSAITTVNSQTSLVLASGATTDSAYVGASVVVRTSAGVAVGIGRVASYTGATKTLVLSHALASITITTSHLIDIVATSRLPGISQLGEFVLGFTVIAATSASAFQVSITDAYGTAIVSPAMPAGALAFKPVIIDTVQAGSGTGKWDNAKIASAAANGDNWDLTLASSNPLAGTPAVGDTGYISLFG